MRADARRNYDRILDAAGSAIAQHGAEASLEDIARRAGVGSATLHRHFPSRQTLLEAVFRDRVQTLCATARDLAADLDPERALVAWLRAVAVHIASNRGLAASLMHGARDPARDTTCHALVVSAGDALLANARRAGAVRPDVAIIDLLKLANAVGLATEQEADGAAEAERLLMLSIDGVRPRGARATRTTR
ncbi:TetR/AcrR family transcriptional regulator [Frankia sp. CNm7]|nr:TetR/AcrR family transcriptional regulator [Frankia nepalensis]MBL7512968.1 TetR/AcrR family transcriptional regulator [Frankia nepalensis]MBL7521326.1 TetR/AcrR family transcriptional regulator [Frankia nepalensis]